MHGWQWSPKGGVDNWHLLDNVDRHLGSVYGHWVSHDLVLILVNVGTWLAIPNPTVCVLGRIDPTSVCNSRDAGHAASSWNIISLSRWNVCVNGDIPHINIHLCVIIWVKVIPHYVTLILDKTQYLGHDPAVAKDFNETIIRDIGVGIGRGQHKLSFSNHFIFPDSLFVQES